ncbi:spore germination protein GerW family protein [Streptomyces sp. Da 82-17]|uniref:spore germination protein GerW family protein n=1 Tax=Streptomyces sp. Da 82-17 TaxID=3377116 RepID=UPI0038D45921
MSEPETAPTEPPPTTAVPSVPPAPATTTAATPATPATDASAALLERLADKLGGRACVEAVFGEPVTAEGVTVIPVARIGYGFGGGAGREVGAGRTGEGGGGGGGAEARPLGFIELRDGHATYKPVRDPWAQARDVLVPLTGLLAAAVGPRIAHRLTRLRGRPRRRP